MRNTAIDVVMLVDQWDQICRIAMSRMPNEDMWFCYVRRIPLPGATRYLVVAVLLLDDDEAERACYAVQPTPKAAHAVYDPFLAGNFHAQGLRVATSHTHPWRARARFSAIDWASMKRDAATWAKSTPDFEFIWLVFDRDFCSFEGTVVSSTGRSEVDQITIVGPRLHILTRLAGGQYVA